MLKIFFTLFLCISCATPKNIRLQPQHKGINPTFYPFVMDYLSIVPVNKFKVYQRLTIDFKKLDGDVVGRCFWFYDGRYEIDIDPGYWNRSNWIQKQFLMYHELEHCVRKRMHTDKDDKVHDLPSFFSNLFIYMGLVNTNWYLEDGCPISIMHSTTMENDCNEKHYHYYIKEMMDYKSL